MTGVIRTETRDTIRIVTLARPEAKNAISRALEAELYAALEEIDSDPEIRVGIIAAEGDIFCAGADLKEAAQRTGAPSPGLERPTIVSRTHRKPLIAAVDGPALGGGFEIVLASDIVIASTAARFALPEVRWGLVASGGGMFRLPRALPRPIANHLLMSGASLSAERAHALGLVAELAPPGGALGLALETAQRIAGNSPTAILNTREVMDRTAGLDEAAAWEISREVAARNLGSGDAREGPRAFAEKRPPSWSRT